MWTQIAMRGVLAAVLGMMAATGHAADKGDRSTKGAKADTSQISKGDQNFMMDAAQGGMLEVRMGKLAQERGQSDAVKQYGKRLEADHSKANEQLMAIAQKNGVTLPTSLDKKHMGHVDKLSKAKAENFDRDFAKQMVDDHQKDIKKFKHIADKVDNAELKQFASQTVPVLEEHLAMARDLTGKGKGGGKGGSK